MTCYEIGEMIEGLDKLSEFNSYFEQLSNDGKTKLTFKIEESKKSGVHIVIVVIFAVLMLVLYLALLFLL